MGIEEVLQMLEQAGIPARVGYPGTAAGTAFQCVAAVNLTGLDTAEGTACISVTLLSPRQRGLAACQEAAAKAAGVLRADATGWSFRDWRYESALDCFAIELVSVRSVVQEQDGWKRQTMAVTVDGVLQSHVTAFEAVRRQERRLIRPHCQSTPVGITPGRDGWAITLTQRLPLNAAEPEDGAEPFVLTVEQGGAAVTFTGCCWSEHTLRYLPGGMELKRSGFALTREVA